MLAVPLASFHFPLFSDAIPWVSCTENVYKNHGPLDLLAALFGRTVLILVILSLRSEQTRNC